MDGRLGIKEDQPLHSPDTMLSYIRGTTTATGLCVTGLLLYHDRKAMPTSIAAVNEKYNPGVLWKIDPHSAVRVPAGDFAENAGDRLLPLGAR